MVRTDGCYVAGYRVEGARTYFADDDGRNEAKAVLEALLRALPEESMRFQCRYEVVESLTGLLDRYREASRTELPQVRALDEGRLEAWEQKEKQGAFLTRIAAIYLIWDPVKHKRMMIASGGPQSKEDRRQAGRRFSSFHRKIHSENAEGTRRLFVGVRIDTLRHRVGDERRWSRSGADDTR